MANGVVWLMGGEPIELKTKARPQKSRESLRPRPRNVSTPNSRPTPVYSHEDHWEPCYTGFYDWIRIQLGLS